MKALLTCRLLFAGVLIAGFLVAWCTAMPQEFDQKASQLFGGFTPWCPCYGLWGKTCANAPGYICSDVNAGCEKNEDKSGTCRDSGDLTCEGVECDEEDGYMKVYCTDGPVS